MQLSNMCFEVYAAIARTAAPHTDYMYIVMHLYAHYCGANMKVNINYSSVVAYMILGFSLIASLK
jgi:riboflavin transporter FmnP